MDVNPSQRGYLRIGYHNMETTKIIVYKGQ